ncbi:hypothetical protein AALP_AA1G127700 [Arabis alpina]|uniref:Pectate lyase n=1 Tax=Arabis alpina TaxID=50452 RepID=A0A087HMV5_ARAAL|nr:hypothetical protein AALP_AA1G127700 [Arabis alpina]
MVSLALIVSFLFATFSCPFLEAANYSNGSTLQAASLNVIDACWRRNPNWATNRQALASCAVGFGKAALGGKSGPIYVVTSPADDAKSPKPGTLRFAVTQPKPLWITFAKDMVIVLQTELQIKSHKTIDGRGAKVEIANGPCVAVYHATNVIIHGISIHDCKAGRSGGKGWEGDAIRIFQSTHVWIDHCSLSRCNDGLIDVIHTSTAVTLSNNLLTQHLKAMLLGHSDKNVGDKKMKVTVVFNVFGPGLRGRMPRVRHGYAHVANNRYEKWGLYAIGGSANPIIFSEGNYFVAPERADHKQVTKRFGAGSNSWKWGTAKDAFMNGAVFGPAGQAVTPMYVGGEAFQVAQGSLVPSLTSSAGALRCTVGRVC